MVVNLASDEYSGPVKPAKLHGVLIKPVFLDEKNGKYKGHQLLRQESARVNEPLYHQNRLTRSEQLVDFNLEGYAFDEAASQGNELVFKRPEQA